MGVSDPRRLVGTWAVGPTASEWIAPAVAAISAAVPVVVLEGMPMEFPALGGAASYAVDALRV